MKILVVGYESASHVGACFKKACDEIGIESKIIDVEKGTRGNRILRSFSWRFFGKRPLRLSRFSSEVERVVSSYSPDVVLTTGCAPVEARILARIRKRCILINYSTDDPWSRFHSSRWFMSSIPKYHVVLTTRKANIEDFKSVGCDFVRYMPFGFDSDQYFPRDEPEDESWSSDVAFVGGADNDRVPYMKAILDGGYNLSLWGGYWNRFSATESVARGFADHATTRKVIWNSSCALVLVRRANRDGHCMRTFEVAALGAPMLVEDTIEHREMFGVDGGSVRYFNTIDEMLLGVEWFKKNRVEGEKMGSRVCKMINPKEHSYTSRMREVISIIESEFRARLA